MFIELVHGRFCFRVRLSDIGEVNISLIPSYDVVETTLYTLLVSPRPKAH
jgi:hypothetical protein